MAISCGKKKLMLAWQQCSEGMPACLLGRWMVLLKGSIKYAHSFLVETFGIKIKFQWFLANLGSALSQSRAKSRIVLIDPESSPGGQVGDCESMIHHEHLLTMRFYNYLPALNICIINIKNIQKYKSQQNDMFHQIATSILVRTCWGSWFYWCSLTTLWISAKHGRD